MVRIHIKFVNKRMFREESHRSIGQGIELLEQGKIKPLEELAKLSV